MVSRAIEQQGHFEDPMAYDVMREVANRVIGRYLEWERTTTGMESQRWQDERIRVRLVVRAVDPDDAGAVREKTAELREVLRHMPDKVPVLV